MLLDAELKHRLNAATINAVHDRTLSVAHCCGRSAAVSFISVI